MILKNKYVIGTLVQFYELDMISDLIKSYIGMLKDIENKQNVTLHFTFSTQEYLEKIDFSKFQRYENQPISYVLQEIKNNFEQLIGVAGIYPANLIIEYKSNSDAFYNIAAYRRDLCWNWSEQVDLVIFGESDSMFPSQTLQILDQLHEGVKNSTPKYIVNFADRKLWDNSFAPLHPKYENVQFKDDDEWQFNSPDSGKGYMSYEQMEEINNIPFEDIKIVAFETPRFDGSCVGFSSDLLKSGVNIPKSLIHCSEDVSIGVIAKKLLGDEFVQYNVSNILHVHNRRRPHKRTGVLGENNPMGKCTVQDKGVWWKMLEDSSKFNYNNLFTQTIFIKTEDVINQIKNESIKS